MSFIRSLQSMSGRFSAVRLLVGSLALATVASCVDEGPSGVAPPTILSVTPVFSSAGRITAPISRIRVTVTVVSTGQVLSRQNFDVPPEAAAWNLAIEVETGAALGAPVLLTVELMSVTGGVEQVEWSGRIGPIDIDTPEPQVHPVQVFPGPLSNLDVTGLAIVDPASTTLIEGDNLQLQATIQGSSAGRAVWTSLNPTVASVGADGRVSALLPGAARIVAEAGRVADTVALTVIQALASVELTPAPLVVPAIGDEAVFTARGLDPRGGNVPGVSFTWSVENGSLARHLGGGRFETLDNGTTTVTVLANRAGSTVTRSATANLVILQGIASLAVSPDAVTFPALGRTQQTSVDVRGRTGAPFSGAELSWRSTDPAVATVDQNGLITAVGNGTTLVIVSGDNVADTVSVTVRQGAETITISPSQETLRTRGATVRFTAQVKDAAGQPVTDLPITWASSDPAVASIDATGLATAHKSGTVQISATVADPPASGPASVAGLTGSVQLVVDLPPATVRVQPRSQILTALGEDARFEATVEDAGGARLNRPVTWSSTNPAVATVDAQGRVVAVADGDVWIVAVAGEARDSVQVFVSQQVDRIRIEPTELSVRTGAEGVLTAIALDWLGNAVADVRLVWVSLDVAVATIAPSGPNQATVTGVSRGTSTIRAIAPSGLAATAEVIVSGGGAGGAGAGLITLFDINYFDNGNGPQHFNFTRNLVTNGERDRVVLYFGHDSWLSINLGGDNYVSVTRDYIRNDLGYTVDVLGDMEGGLTLDDDVSLFAFMMPQRPWSETEVDEMLRYLDAGGRILLIGENSHPTFDQNNARVQEIIHAVGSDAQYVDGCLAGPAPAVAEDPITLDQPSITMNCSSYLSNLSEGDVTLYEGSGQPVVVRIGIVERRALPALRETPFVRVLPEPGTDPTRAPSPGGTPRR